MTDERLKIVFGFSLLLGLVCLAALIALAHVEEKSSYSLREIITGLLVLSGGFSAWAFGSIGKDK